MDTDDSHREGAWWEAARTVQGAVMRQFAGPLPLLRRLPLVRRMARGVPLRKIFILPHPTSGFFEAYVFFETERDLQEARSAGVDDALSAAIVHGLDARSLGPAAGYRIDFVWDSHQNVLADYRGSYFLRLR